MSSAYLEFVKNSLVLVNNAANRFTELKADITK